MNRQMSVLPDEGLNLWFLSKAYDQLSEAEKYFSQFKYPQGVICAYESIEFSLKGMCKLLDVRYDKKNHFLDAECIAILAKKISKKSPEKGDELLGALPMILGYTRELRNICRYGIDKDKVPTVSPDLIFKKDHSERVLEDARRIRDLLHHLDMEKRWGGKK